MTASLSTVKREVNELKRNFPRDKTLTIFAGYSWNIDKPHDQYGCQLITFTTSNGTTTITYSAPTISQTEQFHSRSEYLKLLKTNPHIKKDKDHFLGTYEKWLKYHLCKCGKHGSDGTEPFMG